MVNAGRGRGPQSEPPQRRVVLLGASNLTRGLATVLDTAARHWGQPLEAFIAAGHGRSYGMHSTVFGRRLSGITQCGLWEALQNRPRLPTAALVTDIGNDLLFHAPVAEIAGWVEQCLDRLAELQSCTAMTLLPLANLAGMTPRRYYALRSILFPRCRLPWECLLQRAHELNERVRSLGQARGIPLIEPRGDWYGVDPIHIRFRSVPAAWREILASWCSGPPPKAQPNSWSRWVRLRLLKPEQRWVLGIEQRTRQPAATLADGTTISMY